MTRPHLPALASFSSLDLFLFPYSKQTKKPNTCIPSLPLSLSRKEEKRKDSYGGGSGELG
jgi:hypothetical protein